MLHLVVESAQDNLLPAIQFFFSFRVKYEQLLIIITNMADDKKIIFSMVGVGKLIPPSRQILKDIYLSFFYGAKIGIIGLNGSGKSSLMKIIAGVDKDYQGEVVF